MGSPGRSRNLAMAGLVALAWTAAWVLGGAGCGNGGDGGRGSSLALMAEATRRVEGSFPDALLVQVVALPGPGGLAGPEDTEKWEFDFMIRDNTEALVLPFEDGEWGEMILPGQPFFGVVFDDLNRVTLDLGQALAKLRGQGYTDAYTEWNLFQPLVAGDPPPYYYFLGGANPVPGAILLVDAFTGAITVQ